MDYVLETLEHQLDINFQFQSALFEEMRLESEYILECLENMSVLIEAETNPEKKKNIFLRMIEFITNLFNKFVEATKTLFQSNEKWMKENFPKLDKVDFDGLDITMTPFWLMNTGKINSEIQKLVSKMNQVLNNDSNIEKYKDREALINGEYNEYLDSEKELTGGFKNHFRTGKAIGVKPVTLRGGQLRSQVLGEFRSYCLGYQNNVVPSIKKLADSTKRQLDMVSRTIKTQPTRESFFLIENAFFNETELTYYDNLPVLEAENDDKKPAQNNQQQSSNNNKKPSVTKVQMRDNKDADGQNTQEKLDGMNSHQLTLVKNVVSITQTALAAAMTASEERYHAYMSAIKQVLRARKVSERK